MANTYITYSPAQTYSTNTVGISDYSLYTETNIVGRKIKIYQNTDVAVSVWSQSKSVTANQILYSNGHYYRAMAAGTTGNVQPSHTEGDRSDGAVTWRYLHSGTASATIISVDSASTMTIQLDAGQYLPITTWGAASYVFKTFQWSIWGYNYIYPSNLYINKNRLGFITNTGNYGAWNAMSCTDDYFNFATEEYGSQLDTSAIVHMIGDNETNQISWVLSSNKLYVGSYCAEFVISSASGALSPTTLSCDRISEIGGSTIPAIKYKELNLFAGKNGKELYSVSYDDNSTDYIPKPIGYFVKHLMDKGINRMVGIKNEDQNIYIQHSDYSTSVLNYVGSQKVLSYSEVDFGGDLLAFVEAPANETQAAFAIIDRGGEQLSIESVSFDSPTYMFDTITMEVPDGYSSSDRTVVVDASSMTISGSLAITGASVINNFVWGSTTSSTGTFCIDNVCFDIGTTTTYRLLEAKDGELSMNMDYVQPTSITDFKPFMRVNSRILGFGNYNSSYGYLIYFSEDNGATFTSCGTNYLVNSPLTPTTTCHSAIDDTGLIVVLASLYNDTRTGKMSLVSTNGGITFSANTRNLEWVGFANGIFIGAIRAQYDGGSSGMNFYTSYDGVTWTYRLHITETVFDLHGFHYFNGEYHIVDSYNIFVINSAITSYTTHVITTIGGDYITNSELIDGVLFVRKYAGGYYYYNDLPNYTTANYIPNLSGSNATGMITDGLRIYSVPSYATTISSSNPIKVGDLTITYPDYTEVNLPYFANKTVWVKYDSDLSQFIETTLDADGKYTLPKSTPIYQVGLKMTCDLHTQPAFGKKMEGKQQQAISVALRLNESGAFSFGTSVDFDKYFKFENWGTGQDYNSAHRYYTGDAVLNTPDGYMKQNNVGQSDYPNDTGVGINIRCETPEPFNLLSIQEVYK